MAFVKTINKKGIWIDLYLGEEEEWKVKEGSKENHIKDMKECIEEAKKIWVENKQGNIELPLISIVNIAIALFEKRAIHTQFEREAKARELFEENVDLEKQRKKESGESRAW